MADGESSPAKGVYRCLWGAVAEASAVAELLDRGEHDSAAVVVARGALERVVAAVEDYDRALLLAGVSAETLLANQVHEGEVSGG